MGTPNSRARLLGLGTDLLLAIAAALTIFSFVRSEGNSEGRIARQSPPSEMPDWRRILPVSVGSSARDARVTIIEFVDLECPVCRSFHARLADVRRQQASELHVAYVHYPLTSHRFARAAAEAAECARAQNRLEEFISSVFAKQDSIGLRAWDSFAVDAGVADSRRFNDCMARRDGSAVIDRGIAEGKRIGIEGTPTVIVNGRRYDRAPTDDELLESVRAALENRP